MSDQINLRECRRYIDQKYVGFDINGPKVKPVHVINGIMRVICGKIYDTTGIKRLSYVESKKGKPGYSTDDVLADLIENGMIEDDVNKEVFESFRRVLQLLLDADSAVFDGKDDRMISYSLSSQYFTTRFAMYEDAGEFIGGVIKEYCPALAAYIEEITSNKQDPISVLFSPVLSSEFSEFMQDYRHSSVEAFLNKSAGLKSYLTGLSISGTCLLKNLKAQSNRFTQLRMFNFFCMYQIFRYLSALEAIYCEGNIRPILLDFSKSASVTETSAMSYAQIHKSLSRFYAWGYAQYLSDQGWSTKELKRMKAPIKQEGKVSKTDSEEIESLWDMAKLEADSCDSETDAQIAFGMAMYNMLAREAKFHPANYLRAIGVLSGLLYPPNSSHNRFSVSNDILEMILMCTVEPDITVSRKDIRKRLFERMGIVIGGSIVEDNYLRDSGMIIQVDTDALEQNFDVFAYTLESLGFAEVMADGILQIQLGGVQK